MKLLVVEVEVVAVAFGAILPGTLPGLLKAALSLVDAISGAALRIRIGCVRVLRLLVSGWWQGVVCCQGGMQRRGC